MSGPKTFATLAIAAALAALGAISPAAAFYRWSQGNYVVPCSLDGVNPVYHPEIFRNPAVARAYGFVRARDGTWQVVKNCRPYWPY
jgi:hypothetical protein